MQKKLLKDKSPLVSRPDPLLKIMSKKESRFKIGQNPYSNNNDIIRHGLRSSRNSNKGGKD